MDGKDEKRLRITSDFRVIYENESLNLLNEEYDERRIHTAKELFHFVHSDTSDKSVYYCAGVKTSGGMYAQRLFKYHELDQALNLMKSGLNTYLCTSTFNTISRQKKNVWQIKEFCVDLDAHEFPHLFKIDEVIEVLKTHYFGKVVPYPSYIIITGQGIQLHWTLQEPVAGRKDFNSYRMWQRVQNRLIETFSDITNHLKYLSVDEACKDSNRHWRALGSYHTKAKTFSYIEETCSTFEKYTMRDFTNTYFSDMKITRSLWIKKKERLDEINKEREAQGIRKLSKLTKSEHLKLVNEDRIERGLEPVKELKIWGDSNKKSSNKDDKKVSKVTQLKNLHTKLAGRLIDLQTAQKLFNKKGNRGYRERLMFLYLNTFLGCYRKKFLETKNADFIMIEALAFNEAFNEPLELEEVELKVYSLLNYFEENNDVYRFRDATFIEWLTVDKSSKKKKDSEFLTLTEEEVAKFEYVSLKDKPKRSRSTRDENGLTLEKRKIMKLERKAFELKESGLTYEEIAKKMKKSERTIKRYVKAYKEQLLAQEQVVDEVIVEAVKPKQIEEKTTTVIKFRIEKMNHHKMKARFKVAKTELLKKGTG